MEKCFPPSLCFLDFRSVAEGLISFSCYSSDVLQTKKKNNLKCCIGLQLVLMALELSNSTKHFGHYFLELEMNYEKRCRSGELS